MNRTIPRGRPSLTVSRKPNVLVLENTVELLDKWKKEWGESLKTFSSEASALEYATHNQPKYLIVDRELNNTDEDGSGEGFLLKLYSRKPQYVLDHCCAYTAHPNELARELYRRNIVIPILEKLKPGKSIAELILAREQFTKRKEFSSAILLYNLERHLPKEHIKGCITDDFEEFRVIIGHRAELSALSANGYDLILRSEWDSIYFDGCSLDTSEPRFRFEGTLNAAHTGYRGWPSPPLDGRERRFIVKFDGPLPPNIISILQSNWIAHCDRLPPWLGNVGLLVQNNVDFQCSDCAVVTSLKATQEILSKLCMKRGVAWVGEYSAHLKLSIDMPRFIPTNSADELPTLAEGEMTPHLLRIFFFSEGPSMEFAETLSSTTNASEIKKDEQSSFITLLRCSRKESEEFIWRAASCDCVSRITQLDY